jgi:hypothetical protein
MSAGHKFSPVCKSPTSSFQCLGSLPSIVTMSLCIISHHSTLLLKQISYQQLVIVFFVQNKSASMVHRSKSLNAFPRFRQAPGPTLPCPASSQTPCSSDILAAGWDQHELGPRPQSRRFSPGGVSSNSSPPRSKRDEPSALQLISTVDGAGRASRSEPDRATELLRARSKISKPCGTRVPVIAAATRVRTWDAGWLPFAAATASGRRETRRIWQSGPADSWAITMMPPVHDGQPGRGRARTFPRAFYSPLPSVMAGSKNRGVTSPETKSPNGSVRFSCCACAHTYLDSWSTVLANF